MSLWALIPVKPFSSGKSRLAKVLTEKERRVLIRKLLQHTISTLQSIEIIKATMVISSDREILDLSQQSGCEVLVEEEPFGLNEAINQAASVIERFNGKRMLIIPADLPNLTCEVVRQLLALAGDPPEMIISPDRHEKGTNALYVDPIGMLQFRFGSNSFHKHLENARTKEMKVKIYQSNEFAFDLDSPADLELIDQRRYLKEFIHV